MTNHGLAAGGRGQAVTSPTRRGRVIYNVRDRTWLIANLYTRIIDRPPLPRIRLSITCTRVIIQGASLFYRIRLFIFNSSKFFWKKKMTFFVFTFVSRYCFVGKSFFGQRLFFFLRPLYIYTHLCNIYIKKEIILCKKQEKNNNKTGLWSVEKLKIFFFLERERQWTLVKFMYSTFVMTTVMRMKIRIKIKNVNRQTIIIKPKFKEGNISMEG